MTKKEFFDRVFELSGWSEGSYKIILHTHSPYKTAEYLDMFSEKKGFTIVYRSGKYKYSFTMLPPYLGGDNIVIAIANALGQDLKYLKDNFGEENVKVE